MFLKRSHVYLHNYLLSKNFVWYNYSYIIKYVFKAALVLDYTVLTVPSRVLITTVIAVIQKMAGVRVVN